MTSRGSTTAFILILGEAPGKREAQTGKPFTGPAGKLLDKWLVYLELGLNDYMISNIVKCHPPDNATPTSEQRMACLIYTYLQIKYLQPPIVWPLGSVAQEGVRIIKRTWPELTFKLVKSKHPAYYLHKGFGHEYILEEELSKIRRIIDGERNNLRNTNRCLEEYH